MSKPGFILIGEKGQTGGVEVEGTATSIMLDHLEVANPHEQYALEAQRQADYSALSTQINNAEAKGTVASALATHKSESTAHTPAQVGADPAGSASTAMSNHTAAPNPHPQYSPSSHSHTPGAVGADPAGTGIHAVLSHESTTNHPMATNKAKGMMSATDKTKLDGLGSASTKNTPSEGNALHAEVVLGSDTRLSDPRTPLAHSHSVASVSGLGDAATKNTGTTAGTVASGDDPRFTDARSPFGSAGGDFTGTYPNPVLRATGIAPGIYTKVVVDEKGRVREGGTLTATDIPTLDTSKISGLSSVTWYNLTLVNGWSSTLIQYAKLTNGLMLLKGLINKSSKASIGEIIATVPSGFRPDTLIRFRTLDSASNSTPYLDINSQGQILYGNTGNIPSSTSGLSLAGILYYGS